MTDKIVSNPEIKGGVPVIEGTRIPASKVAHLVANGLTYDAIIKDYPTLTPGRIEAAVAWQLERDGERQQREALAALRQAAGEVILTLDKFNTTAGIVVLFGPIVDNDGRDGNWSITLRRAD